MAGTGVRFTVFETDDETKVDYGQGQFIIEDDGKLFYDPTGTFGGRIEFYRNEFMKIDAKLRQKFAFKGITNFPPSQKSVGDVYLLSNDIASGQYLVHYATFGPQEFSGHNYEVVEIEAGVYKHIFAAEIVKSSFSSDVIGYVVAEIDPLISFENQNGYEFIPETPTNFTATIRDEGTFLSIIMTLVSNDAYIQDWADTTSAKIDIQLQNPQFHRGEYICWVGDYWSQMTYIYDLSGYATKTYVDNLVGTINEDIEDLLTEGV